MTLHHETHGDGELVVLVHGGWSDLNNWQSVVPGLAQSFHVVAYDRCGHGRSGRVAGVTRRDQEDQLAQLIEGLDGGPVRVVGTSFGGSIALGLTARRPDLVRSMVAHEPPLMALLTGPPSPQLVAVTESLNAVTAQIAAGDAAGAARRFAEEVAFGPGAWDQLPAPRRASMIANAPALVTEQHDPGWAAIDTTALAAIRCPVLITQGDQSPPWFGAIVARLADLMPAAEVLTYPGAGHSPHFTHPAEYVASVTAHLTPDRTLA